LRVIQEKSYRPIGSHKEFKVNLKIIAATNRSLADEVKKGLFRDDLYYRLNVLFINIPSLRDRREDIVNITKSKFHALNFGELSNETLENIALHVTPIFEAYDWPGNIRELENIIERLLVYCSVHKEPDSAKVTELLQELAPELFVDAQIETTGELAKNEHELVMQAMNKFNGNKELVAQFLGISQTTLWRRLKRFSKNNQRGQQHA
jgi:propionate catabolism operon transcriptional regulator